jgi:hypothetical protein
VDLAGAVMTGGLLGVLLLSQGIVALAHWRVQLTAPRGVLRRLRGHDGRHSVRFGPNRFAWNPAEPLGVTNKVQGPGLAHYSLDDAGTIHLVFVTRQGDVQRFSGPAPSLTATAEDDIAKSYLLGQPATAGLGFLLGFLLDSGSVDGRLAVGFLAGVGGWFAAWVVVASTTSIIRTRAFAAQRH